MPATAKKMYFRGIVPDSEHWITKKKITFRSPHVERGKYEAQIHLKLTCGHTVPMKTLRKSKMPIRTHCQQCCDNQKEDKTCNSCIHNGKQCIFPSGCSGL